MGISVDRDISYNLQQYMLELGQIYDCDMTIFFETKYAKRAGITTISNDDEYACVRHIYMSKLSGVEEARLPYKQWCELGFKDEKFGYLYMDSGRVFSPLSGEHFEKLLMLAYGTFLTLENVRTVLINPITCVPILQDLSRFNEGCTVAVYHHIDMEQYLLDSGFEAGKQELLYLADMLMSKYGTRLYQWDSSFIVIYEDSMDMRDVFMECQEVVDAYNERHSCDVVVYCESYQSEKSLCDALRIVRGIDRPQYHVAEKKDYICVTVVENGEVREYEGLEAIIYGYGNGELA